MKISIKSVIIFFLLFPHFKPESFEYIAPAVETLINALRMASALFALIIYLTYNIRRKHFSPPVILLSLYTLWIIAVTYFKRPESLLSAAVNLGSMVAMVLLVDYFLQTDGKKLLKVLMLIFEILAFSNLLTVLIYYPKGMYHTLGQTNNYLLGLDNKFIVYLLPAILVSILYYGIFGKLIRPLLLITASVVQIMIVWPATSVVALGIMTAILLLRNSAIKNKIIMTPFFLWACTLVADVLITIVRITMTYLPLQNFIVNFLHKDITLSNRFIAWNYFMVQIKESPIVGFGYGEKVYRQIGAYAHAHNQYFQVLLIGGLVALVLFMFVNYMTLKIIKRCKRNLIYFAFLSAFTAMYFFFISEAFLNLTYFIIFPLAWHIQDIEVFGENTYKTRRLWLAKIYKL